MLAKLKKKVMSVKISQEVIFKLFKMMMNRKPLIRREKIFHSQLKKKNYLFYKMMLIYLKSVRRR